MKKMIFALSLILAANTVSAKVPGQKLSDLKELCALDAAQDDENAYENAFTTVSTLDIKEISSLTEAELIMANAHLIGEEYTTANLTFAEIKALFSEGGDQHYNDLYIITFKSNVTGRIYTQVKSYPGDNPYALIFDAKKLKAVAHNGDDSIVLLTDNGSYSCWELSQAGK